MISWINYKKIKSTPFRYVLHNREVDHHLHLHMQKMPKCYHHFDQQGIVSSFEKIGQVLTVPNLFITATCRLHCCKFCWPISWLVDYFWWHRETLIAMFMGPTWGPSGAERTQVGPMLAPWTLLSGKRNFTVNRDYLLHETSNAVISWEPLVIPNGRIDVKLTSAQNKLNSISQQQRRYVEQLYINSLCNALKLKTTSYGSKPWQMGDDLKLIKKTCFTLTWEREGPNQDHHGGQQSII